MLFRSGKFVTVSQSGAVKDGKLGGRPQLGATPLAADLLRGKITDPLAKQAFDYAENVSQAGMWLALPPGVPKPLVVAWVRAYEATLKDAAYQAEWSRIDPDSPLATRGELAALTRALAKVEPRTLDYIQAELKRQGFGAAR